jgi:hypothetical protein
MANPNPSPSTRFVKGDARINRKGRPKDFNALRELAQQIANEPLVSTDGKTKMTRVEMVMRSWAASKNYQLQKAFIEIAYGKVPDELDIKSDGEKIAVIGLGVNTDKL